MPNFNIESGLTVGNDWDVSLGIVRIYNGALTPTQIATNYNANKTRFGLT